MKSSILQRTIIILLVTLGALYLVIGPRSAENLRSYFVGGFQRTLGENINLGLDLKGGSHLVMRVQVAEYLKRLTQNAAINVQKAAQDAGLPVREARAEIGNETYRVIVESNDPARVNEIRDQLPGKSGELDPDIWTATTGGNAAVFEMRREAQTALSNQAVSQAEAIIRSRIDAVGVTEPTLQRHGTPSSYQLLLQMPGVQDPERIKELLRTESRLELAKVITTPQRVYATREAAEASLGGKVPTNRRIIPNKERDDVLPGDPPVTDQGFSIVEAPAVVEGSELSGAQAISTTGSGDRYQINFQLKPAGAAKFGAFTAASIGQPLGIVLNDELLSAPTIQGQISDNGQITGNFTKQTAEGLALTLRSGALPAPIKYEEERTVGPSLGADSIRSGVYASLAGLTLVVLFMVFYYKGSGINAVVALVLNMILTVAALVVFDATLTLPGIAGLVLTIGMAVDSNVLIFERIREELKTGKTVGSAVEQGFARAFTTIIDTHVTTIVSSLFLFVFGTGPIRGFAVTLVLGLLINLFTAVYVSRTIFMYVLERRRLRGQKVETLSI